MAYFNDNNALNSALQKLGYDPLPQQQQPLSQPAKPAEVAQPAEPMQPPSTSVEISTPSQSQLSQSFEPPPPKKEHPNTGVQAIDKAGQALESNPKEDTQGNAMRKVGALIGTVLSAYTGNAAGVAGGVKGMKGS